MPLAAEQLIDAAVNQHLIEAGMLAQLRLEARRKRVDLLEAIAAHYRLPISALYQAAAEMRSLPSIPCSGCLDGMYAWPWRNPAH